MHIILPRFFINCERWKWNSDLRIYVSTYGHVKNEHKQNVPLKINNGGYFCVMINGNVYLVHRLVLLTWRPLPVDGSPMTVDHLDSNKRNNRLDNLEWVSQEENLRRADEKLIKESTHVVADSLRGEKVTWEDLAKYDIHRETLCSGRDGSRKNKQKSKLRQLFVNGDIVGLCNNEQITPEWLMEHVQDTQNSSKRTIFDRFLRRSLDGYEYFGKVTQLYWRKE